MDSDLRRKRPTRPRIARPAAGERATRAVSPAQGRLALLASFPQLERTVAGGAGAGTIALLLVDLDDFRTVNDGLGRGAGDEVLSAVAARLQQFVTGRPLARLGGDEFALIVPSHLDPERVASGILEALSAPLRVRDRTIRIRGSVGIAAGASFEQLVADAGVAVSHAKSRGGDCYVLYEHAMRQSLLHRLELGAELDRAGVTEETFLEYQPIFDLRTGQAESVEALLRWRHPTRGVVPPLEFVPLAEQNGRIVDLGRWVLEHACTQVMCWNRSGADRAIAVAVNVSARQLADPSFVRSVTGALARSGLQPEKLTIELTETTLMQNGASATRSLGELRRIGVRVAIDDFGTGYSSLSYLGRLPIDEIKVDRSFLDQSDNRNGLRLLQAITTLGQDLGLKVTAEGVETREQLKAVRRLGCAAVQGYLLGVPRPAEDTEARLHLAACVPGVADHRRSGDEARPAATDPDVQLAWRSW